MGLLDKLRRRQPVSLAAPAGLQPPPQVPPSAVGLGFAVVDVETTGLVPARDRVVEVAVVRADPWGRLIDEWTTLVNPAGPVGATHIHGIATADVRRAPQFVELLSELNSRLAGRALVAHNAGFDMSFLKLEYARAGWELPAAPFLCTLDASSTYLPHLSRRRLPDCCWAAGIQLHDAHSALGDARATAALLAFYLNPRFGLPPTAEHVNLPTLATTAAWPSIPSRPITVTLRPARTPVVPASPGRLATLLEDLPLSSAVEEGAPLAATPYLELLAEVLEDGVLTDAEAVSLVELAKLYTLTREQIQAAHRGFLLALAHKAIEDGKVTRDERAELLTTAGLLGFSDGIVKSVLDEAQAAWEEQRGKNTRPLPADWAHGEPLRVGQGVAFTGCDDIERARLEGRARGSGLRVTGSVSRKTALLITDGAFPNTTKAISAREFGTRIVSPAVFAQMVQYIQPATEAPPSGRTGTVPQQKQRSNDLASAEAPTNQALPLEDPAAIRAWARTQGFEIGGRGRLPANVLLAYREAHGSR